MVRCVGGFLNAAGGLLGSGKPEIASCYWDAQTSGLSVSAGTGAEGKTTAEMKQKSTYAGWDFSSVWDISGGYPYLRALGKTKDTNI
jgi:hypothetical protein